MTARTALGYRRRDSPLQYQSCFMRTTSERPTDQSIAWLVQFSTNKFVADVDAVEARLGVVS